MGTTGQGWPWGSARASALAGVRLIAVHFLQQQELALEQQVEVESVLLQQVRVQQALQPVQQVWQLRHLLRLAQALHQRQLFDRRQPQFSATFRQLEMESLYQLCR